MKKPLRLERKEPNYILWGFLLPFFAMMLMILGSMLVLKIVYPTRVYSMLYSDMYHQYYPFFKAFRQTLRNGESLLFSWNVGLGMDYLGLISYYLASPLNLLSVLVPENWLLGYFTLLTPVKLGFAGMFFALFLQKIFKRNDFSIAVFGGFYGLCAWALGYQWNIMWLDTFALLPLVALGTVNVLKERKFALYTISLFLSIFANYYIGFFTCIFVLLLCICYEISRWKGFKKMFIDIFLMAFFSVLAIGMTAILELPALAALGTTQSSVNEAPTRFLLNIADENTWQGLLDAMRQVLGNTNGGLVPNFKATEGLPNLYCGIGTNLFAFIYLSCKQVRVRDKVCAILLLLFFNVSFIIRTLDYIWHGFHFTNMIPYRFSFLYSFVMLYMAYCAWNVRRRIRLWQVGLGFLPAIAVLIMSNDFASFAERVGSEAFHRDITTLIANFQWSEADFSKLSTLLEDFIFIAYNGVFLLLYGVCMLFAFRKPRVKAGASREEKLEHFDRLKIRRRTGTVMLLFVLCAELVLNMINFSINHFPGTNVSGYPKGTEDSARIIRIMQQREEDTLFYRAEVTHTQTLNDGALNGYNGISTFTSSANMNVTKFMQHLGYAAKDNWNRYIYEEASPVSNLFLNLKYMIERDGLVENNPYFTDLHHSGKVHLLENNYYLPLGFMTDEKLADLVFYTNGDRFKFQNRLLSAATGREMEAWTIIEGDALSFGSRDVTLNSTTDSGYCSYSASADGGSIYFTYSFEEAGFFCLDLNFPKKNNFILSYEAAGSDYVTLYSESYSLPQMAAVCQVNPGDRVQLTIKCAANERSSLTVSAALLNQAVFEEAYSILSASTLELTEFSNTLVEGTVSCQQDGLLYTSIPQNGNWKVFVDGEPAEAVLIGGAMTGVMLTEGDHTVTFRYESKAFILGCIISAGSLLLFLIPCWFVYFYPWLKKRKKVM